MEKPILLPMPRKCELTGGMFCPGATRRTIQLDGTRASDLTMAGRVIRLAVKQSRGQDWPIIAGGGASDDIAVSIFLGSSGGREHYSLSITSGGVQIRATSPAMAFYAANTLAQLLRQYPDQIPCLAIEDSPDFAARGVMLDISRDKVPTTETLYALVDLLASMKINQLQLYTEHTFAYQNHTEVWAEASPMTGEEILALDAYCRERFIELVPNQNSFGHMERWLKLPRYQHLAETPDGFSFPWGLRHEGGFTLDPGNPESLSLVESLFDELLPHFTSRLFNVGCDETFDLGLGRSKAEVEKRGKERVYMDFLMKIHHAATSRGRQMMFWGDIILHKPELIPELPKDMIALNWGYDVGHPFEKETRAFHEAGVPFYVCPGTSSWLTIGGRTDNCLGNLRDAAEQGLKHGSIGFLNTDWGDVGHLQYLPISYLGLAAGAAYSWCVGTNRDASIADQLSLHVLDDSTLAAGKMIVDFGNVYQHVKSKQFNSTAMFWSFVGGVERKHLYDPITMQEADATLGQLQEIEQRLSALRMRAADASLIVEEIGNAISMYRHGAKRARWRADTSSESTIDLSNDLRQIIGQHEKLWIARNRVGGMRDSVRRLETRLGDYGVKRVGSAFG